MATKTRPEVARAVSRSRVALLLVPTFVLAAALVLAGCGGSPSGEGGPSAESPGARQEEPAEKAERPEPTQPRPEVVVMSDSSTFDTMLTELYALALEDAGFAVDREYAEETDPALAFEQGDADLYVVYTSDPSGGGSEGEARGLRAAGGAPMGYALLMEGEAAASYGISDVSRLAADGDLRVAASDDSFDGSEDAMVDFWDVAAGDGEGGSRDVFVTSGEEAIAAIDEGEAEAALAWNTSGEISRDDLMVLDDREDLIDEQSIYLMPVVRAGVTAGYPAATGVLNGLSGRLDLEDVRALDAAVRLDGESPEDAARERYGEMR